MRCSLLFVVIKSIEDTFCNLDSSGIVGLEATFADAGTKKKFTYETAYLILLI